MQANFLDAHERHWSDAERLFLAKRYANADHLYGMAAECGLKRLMVRFGMVINSATGSPTDYSDKKHANNLWARFESYRNGKMEGIDYMAYLPLTHLIIGISQTATHTSPTLTSRMCKLTRPAQRPFVNS